MYRTLSAPISVQIEVTEHCSRRCTHCFNYWLAPTEGRKLHTLSIDQIEHIVSRLAEAGVFDVTFTGGEPLLFFDVLLAGLKKAKELRLACGLNSTLAGLDEHKAHLLHQNGIAGVLTSLAGPSPEIHDKIVGKSGAFEETISGIKTARAERIRVTANMVVTVTNENLVLETGRLAHAIGCTGFGATRATAPGYCPNFNEVHKVGRETIRKNLRELLQLQRGTGITVDIFEHYPHCLLEDLATFQHFSRRRCTAGKTAATIGADGNIRPCSHVPSFYGNIFQDGFEVAWKAMAEWRDGSLLPEECKACKYIRQCTGGCRMAALSYSGDIRGMDPDAPGGENVIPFKRKLGEVELPTALRVNPAARFRDEAWGGCAKVTDGGTIFLSPDGYRLVQTLSNRESFTLRELEAEFQGFGQSAGVKFFRQLFRRRLVIEAKGR